MINVEGVIVGNSRCDSNGYDPNRLWNPMNNQLEVNLV